MMKPIHALVIVVLGTVLLPACSTDVAQPNFAEVNPAVEITVAFEGGSTTPTTIKSSTPTAWNGNLCAPAALKFSGQIWPASSDAPGIHIYTFDNCAPSADPTFYVCTPSGAPRAADGLQPCAPSPIQTNLSAFAGGSNLATGQLNGPWTNTAGVTSLVMFYCATGDNFVAPPAVSSVGCQKR
jgi:hypothetical protein